MSRAVLSRLLTVTVAGALLAAAPPGHGRADLVSYAHVNEDATLRVRNRIVRLYGIHIPPTGRTCERAIQPPRCTSRAARALEFRIQGFVRCATIEQHADGTITARCQHDGIDLSEYLLSQGWAMALPDAPFAYVALERIARQRGLGVWGFPADRVTRDEAENDD